MLSQGAAQGRYVSEIDNGGYQMKISTTSALVGMLLTTVVVAQNLEVLETYYSDSDYQLTDWYPESKLAISESGDVLGLYGRSSWGEASYILRQYPENEAAVTYYIGGYEGNGGSYYPKICGFYEQNLMIQISCFGDIVEPYDTHSLRSIDVSGQNSDLTQYFYTQAAQIKGIWKTDSSHGCMFLKKWEFDGADTLLFVKQIDLSEDWQDQFDSSFVVNGDTLLEISSVSSFYQEKLRSDNTFFSIYHLTDSDNWSAVCVSLDSIVTQLDSIFPKSTTIPQLDATEEVFRALFKMPEEESIYLWTYNPTTSETTSDLVYTSPSLSPEFLPAYQATVLPDQIVLQIPVRADGSSYEISNWYALINKRISRSDYSLLSIDTVFIFEPQTDIIRHQIENDGVNPHTLIGTRTPEYSRIYYYGVNSLVSVQGKQHFAPSELAIQNAYPNPFNNQLNISISLPIQHNDAMLQIFDLKGRMVWSKKDIQGNSILWEGRDHSGWELDSGIYILKLSNGSLHVSRKILMIK